MSYSNVFNLVTTLYSTQEKQKSNKKLIVDDFLRKLKVPKQSVATQCTNDTARKVRDVEKKLFKFKKFYFNETDVFKKKISALENEKSFYLEEDRRHAHQLKVLSLQPNS